MEIIQVGMDNADLGDLASTTDDVMKWLGTAFGAASGAVTGYLGTGGQNGQMTAAQQQALQMAQQQTMAIQQTQPFDPIMNPYGKKSFMQEYGTVVMIGGALAVAGVAAVMLTKPKSHVAMAGLGFTDYRRASTRRGVRRGACRLGGCR